MNDETGAIGDAGNDLARYIREATRNNFRWTESRFLGVPHEYAAPLWAAGIQKPFTQPDLLNIS